MTNLGKVQGAVLAKPKFKMLVLVTLLGSQRIWMRNKMFKMQEYSINSYIVLNRWAKDYLNQWLEYLYLISILQISKWWIDEFLLIWTGRRSGNLARAKVNLMPLIDLLIKHFEIQLVFMLHLVILILWIKIMLNKKK